jgi:hypothetical protein
MRHKCLGFALACAVGLPVLGSPTLSDAKPSAAHGEAPKAKAPKVRKAKPKAKPSRSMAPLRPASRENSKRAKAAPRVEAKAPPRAEPAAPLPPRIVNPVPQSAPSKPRPRVAPIVEKPPSPAEQELASSLQLEVTPSGPHATWEARVLNRGQHSVWVATDARLLWFEATVPGRKDPVVCRLPGVMLPGKLEGARPRHLGPGDSFSFRVDPRMFCFEKGDQFTLVPGTFLRPYFGWPERTATSWASGKKRAVRLEQSMPFVARALVPAVAAGANAAAPVSTEEEPEEIDSASDGAPDEAHVGGEDGVAFEETSLAEFPGAAAVPPGPSARSSTPAQPTPAAPANVAPPASVDVSTLVLSEPGLKRLMGEGFALDSTYIGWAHTRLREPHDGHTPRPPSDLALEVSYGSDAVSPRDVTVAVTLRNLGDSTQRAYFRRDLIAFSVVGPDGEKSCEADDSFRAPESSGFLTLGPHQAETLTTRLLEFCAEDVFARPGFYYVSAHLSTESLDDDVEASVFRGRLASDKPRPVRVHTAELPFRARKRPTFASSAGAAPAEAPAPPPPGVQQVQQPVQPQPQQVAPPPAAPPAPPAGD